MKFNDEVAVVTGSGSGIGRATAELLAAEGARVVVVDLNQSGARSTASTINSSGGTASYFVADVSSESEVQRVFDETVESLGVPTIVVNCAGILHLAPAIDTSVQAFDHVISTNLRSVFMMSVAAAQRMISAGLPGAIVNVSSIHAVLSEPNAVAYTAAKGGIEAMSRTFASEWAVHGIRVNCVRPGATRTALTESIYTDDILNALRIRVPMGIPAVPEQIAKGICFLASSEASYCTGTTLDIDGGYIMDGSLPQVTYQ